MRVVRWTTVLAVLCFAVFGVALSVSLSWGVNDQQELDRVTRANCLQIEALKAEFRKQAQESYERLPQTARLLGLELTPELQEAAEQARAETFARFARRAC